jgi:glycosyltransferase involved in cell wall biosynthesis
MREVPFGLDLLQREVQVRKAGSQDTKAELTVFLGIYNAGHFISDLLTSIRNQNWTSSVNLLIVDNNSADDSLRILKESLPDMESNVTIVRNLTNVGALGSLYRNADLVDTEWLTFMHQDDVYLPNFLDSCLREARLVSASNVSTISFDYRTVEGESAPSHSPNPTWFAKGSPGYISFQESLANHSIPWPCTVFRSDYLLQFPVPFHSAAFLDTEIALNQAHFGVNKYVSEVVMNYRIHGDSGSHSLPMAEAEVLRCSSMLRVFNSLEFRSVVRTVPADYVEEWVISLVKSTLNYVDSQRLRDIMAISLLESIVLALDYKSGPVNKLLASELSRIGAAGSGSIVAGLRGGSTSAIPPSLFGLASDNSGESSTHAPGRTWVLRLAQKLPKNLVLLIFRLTPKKFVPHPWSSYK